CHQDDQDGGEGRREEVRGKLAGSRERGKTSRPHRALETRGCLSMTLRPSLRVAMVTTDARGPLASADEPDPCLGRAPHALLECVSRLPDDVEVHVVSCVQTHVRSPAKLADNIFFYNLVVPKWGWLRTSYQGCIRAVRRHLRQLQPHLVHGQGTER